ncbi:hypothetical protein Tco_0576271 [Tanacetum coccineum]
MDPNSSVEKICLGEDNRISLNDGIESHGEWETLECQDTTSSKQKKEAKAFTFYRMETEEVSERYIALSFVNGLEAYDGEINLEQYKNMISNEFTIKLCLEHEDDIKPGVILGRSFMRLTKGIANFENGIITIYPKLDPFLDNSDETKKSENDWELILDGMILVDIPELEELVYHRFLKLDGEIKSEEEEAIKRAMGGHEALKEKEDPSRTYGSFERRAMPGGSNDHYCKVLILDMPIDKEVPILLRRGFLYTCGSILDTIERTTSTFDGICHQKFRAAKTNKNTEESDSDDDEDYCIKRNSLGAPIYGPKFLERKGIGFLGSFPVPLQHMKWILNYEGNFCMKEEGDGQWHAEVRLTDIYKNVYDQGFKTKPTDMNLSKYHKLSDVMSPNWFQK